MNVKDYDREKMLHKKMSMQQFLDLEKILFDNLKKNNNALPKQEVRKLIKAGKIPEGLLPECARFLREKRKKYR